MNEDKVAAYLTLHEMLIGVAKLVAPFTPFLAEEIYRNLEAERRKDVPESIHLCEYPSCDEGFVNLELERDMELARKVVTLGRAARNRANIKNRQPLSELVVALAGRAERQAVAALEQLVKEELNVKAVRSVEGTSQFVAHSVKPRYDLLGPKHGRLIREIVARIATLDPEDVATRLEHGGTIEVPAGDGSVAVSADELIVETVEKEGYVVESDSGLSCALNTTLSHELVIEGLAREMVNKIQTMRKEADFDIEDRICTVYWSDAVVKEACDTRRGYVMGETLSEDLMYAGVRESAQPRGELSREWDVNGHRTVISLGRRQ